LRRVLPTASHHAGCHRIRHRTLHSRKPPGVGLLARQLALDPSTNKTKLLNVVKAKADVHKMLELQEEEPMVSYTPVFEPRSVVEEARPVGLQTAAPASDINKVKCRIAVLLLRIKADH
jgi:hypothetical protein